MGGYVVEVPSLPGCFTQGDTVDEALANAREAIALHIESLLAHGEDVPDDFEESIQVMTVEEFVELL